MDKNYNPFDIEKNFPEDGPCFNKQEDLSEEAELLQPEAEADQAESAVPQSDPAKEMEDFRLRTLAEMENFKKRLQREQDERLAYASEKVLADLLPTLDNFDLALQYGSQVDACKDVLMGVEMTRKSLLDALKNHGLDPIGQVGDEFDPNFHEALGQDNNPDFAPGAVSRVLQKGYKLKERLLRPAKVMVNASKSGLDRKV